MTIHQVRSVVSGLLGILLLTSHVVGQDGAVQQKAKRRDDNSLQASESEKREIRVFQLQYIDPDHAIEVLGNVLGGPGGRLRLPTERDTQSPPQLKFAPDRRTRSIIAAGDASALEKVEDLLHTLDVPQPPVTKQEETYNETYTIQNVPLRFAESQVEQLDLAGLKVHSDATFGKLMVVTKSEEDLQRVNQLISKVEMEAGRPIRGDLQIRVVWLVGSSLMQKDAPQVPADLTEPIAKLAMKLDIGELRTAAQVLVNVNRAEAKFRASGTVMLDQEYSLEIEGGQGMRTLKNHSVNLGIFARRQGSDKPLINQETEIIISPGRPVILGMTPIGSKTSVFVVELLDISASDSESKSESKQEGSNTGR